MSDPVRVEIPLQTVPANGGKNDGITWTAADADNDHFFDNTSGNVLLVARNDAVGTKTVTIPSVADPYGRTKDTTLTVPAIASTIPGNSIAGPFPPARFNQTGAQVYVNITDATTLYFAAIQILA
jgi:hypothetical protein